MHQRTPKDIQGDMAWYLDIMLEMADRTVEQICSRQNIKPEKAYPAAVSLVMKSVDLMNEEAEREQVEGFDVSLAKELIAVGHGRELKPHDRILSGNPPAPTLEDIREKLRAHMKSQGIE